MSPTERERIRAAETYARERVYDLAGGVDASERPGLLAAFRLGCDHARRQRAALGWVFPWPVDGSPVVVAYAWGVWSVAHRHGGADV